MMGQIDLAIFSMLLLTLFSGTKANCSLLVQNGRNDLYSEFMRTWSHLYCGISHEGREHNRTRHHDLSHGGSEKRCIENFEQRSAHDFFNPVMECIRNISNNTREKNRSCFEDKNRRSSLTPELKKLANDIIRKFNICCSHNAAKREIRMLKTRHKPSEKSRHCIKGKFRVLLELFNADNDALEHLDMLVKKN